MASSSQSTYCRTATRYSTTVINWIIDYLSLNRKGQSKLSSSKFCEKTTSREWYASLHFTKKSDDTRDVNVYITNSFNNYLNYVINACVAYEVFNVKTGKELVRGVSEKKEFPSRQATLIFTIEKQTLLAVTEDQDYNGEVKFHFEIRVLSSSTDMVAGTFITDVVPESRLLKDIGLLLKSQKFCDVVFCVEGKEFGAHKGILTSRSSVFAAMFQHEMLELKESKVIIEDVRSDVFFELLRFVYTGKVENIDNIAHDLFRAADKYALMRLKVMCEVTLFRRLSQNNVLETLVLADRHSADKLKNDSLSFISNNAKKVADSLQWETFLCDHPVLVKDLLLTMLSKYFIPFSTE